MEDRSSATRVPESAPKLRVQDLLGLAVLGALLWPPVEFFSVVLRKRSEFAGLWELTTGAFGLLPVWLSLGILPAVFAGFLYWSAEAPKETRVRVGSVLFVLATALGYGVGGGRHLATLPLRLGFAVAVGLAAFGFCWFLWTKLALVVRGNDGASSEGGSFWARLSRAVPLVLAALFFAANEFVLVRLYPALHFGLSFLTSAFIALFFLRMVVELSELNITQLRRISWLGLGLAVLALAGVIPGSRRASRLDNFRFVVAEASPSLGFGVEVAAKIAPPPALDLSVTKLPLGARRERATEIDFRGHDILLITVDALRADHLGAYGYERGTSPRLDAIAKEGIVFDGAYAATPHTSYSLTSLMTGKYMRPLLLQGAGADSALWPELLQTYGYRTAGFYPPAVFFIDGERFAPFRDKKFGFEYAKVEFAEGELRTSQVTEYLANQKADQRVFLWLHLFGPHEPYVSGPKSFGERDVDRYDSEIWAADETIGKVVDQFRKRDPESLVIISADHGEEFGDHGGRYHGTTVYEEQVRVPLIIQSSRLPKQRRIAEPVQTIDLLPTVLSGLSVPLPPRLRGRDLTPLLAKSATLGAGRAVAETDEYALYAEGNFRLICGRKTGACQLFDLAADPKQERDLSKENAAIFERLREMERGLSASHGEFETQGLLAEGKGYPPAILRGLSGDVDVAPELARLLDDVDLAFRRKAAELLFRLPRPETAAALRLALTREEDPETRAWLSLALTRLGQGAPLVHELLHGENPVMRRSAALALAEQGDKSGEEELVLWWRKRQGLEFDEAKEILAAFGKLRSKEAVGGLVASLSDVRLRPKLAETLGKIGDEDAVPFLLRAFMKERYASARLPLAEALYALGTREEMASPLIRFLGVPDPMAGGLALASSGNFLDEIGGPKAVDVGRLRRLAPSGLSLEVIVPGRGRQEPGQESPEGVRLLVLVRAQADGAMVLVAPGEPRNNSKKHNSELRNSSKISEDGALRIPVPKSEAWAQLTVTLPSEFRAHPGRPVALNVLTSGGAEISALAVVPLRSEIPPPPPKPWRPGAADED